MLLVQQLSLRLPLPILPMLLLLNSSIFLKIAISKSQFIRFICYLVDLPGFTRSVYEKDHAVITPESHVFSPLPNW